MPSRRLLHRENMAVPLEAATLQEAVALLTERLHAAGTLSEPARLEAEFAGHLGRSAVRAGRDIALPHFRTDAVSSVAVALGVAPSPLQTGDPEWQPGPRIVALVLAPTAATTPYLQAVSALAAALKRAEVVDGLLAARSIESAFSIPALAELEAKPETTAGQIMVGDVESVRPETSAREAVERMLRSGSRVLPVVGLKGEVLGTVSEADVLRALAPGRALTGAGSILPPLRVRDIMSRSVMCVAETAALEDVANLMNNKDVGEIPVVAEGKLVGIVRRGDILRTLYGR